ncbi:MAG: tRNA dimethylallyltransferase [Ilumatobacter sp.]|jgi:tRNA dimethylallyltransferase
MAVAAQLGDVELISVDSMQVYRGLDIGTAKPSPEDQAAIRHHCIDIAEATAEFTVAEFKRAHASALGHIAARGQSALLVGGTGLYHRVVIDDFDLPGEWPEVRAGLDHHETNTLYQRLSELDPKAIEKIDPENRRRLLRALEVTIGSGRPFSSFGPGVDHYPNTGVAQVGVRWPRPVIAERIEARVHAMIDAGLVAEVAELSEAGFSKTSAQALGYKETLQHLRGEISHDEAVAMIIIRTRQFAVRQERWFRRDPRVRWIDVESDPVAEVAPTVIEELQRA